ncbi:MAG: hypothetical protein V1692_01285 [bacterium]
MTLLITNIYLFIMAVVLAVLEIQIEGAQGWAGNLPAWKPRPTNWLAKVYRKLMNGKELTGYHLMMFGFVFLVFHLPYVFGLALNLDNWLKTLSLFFIFLILWDFLWFVLNPHYPLKKFKKEHIIWHKRWFWLMPIDYYFGLILSFLVLIPILSSLVINWWIMNIFLFLIQVIIIILFSLLVLKIDNWHLKR